MKALINPQQNNIVVQVVSDAKIFLVAEPLFWVDCTNEIDAYNYVYINDNFEKIKPSEATAEQNKQTATELLKNTDWSALPSIANPAESNPYLSNQNEFIAWRSKIRSIAINPIAGNLDWEQEPIANWQSE